MGIYESDAGMGFDADTIFTDHDTFWMLTGSVAGSYSGPVDFFVEREGCVDGDGERSKCEWPGNPGQRNDEPYLTDDGAEAQQNA